MYPVLTGLSKTSNPEIENCVKRKDGYRKRNILKTSQMRTIDFAS